MKVLGSRRNPHAPRTPRISLYNNLSGESDWVNKHNSVDRNRFPTSDVVAIASHPSTTVDVFMRGWNETGDTFYSAANHTARSGWFPETLSGNPVWNTNTFTQGSTSVFAQWNDAHTTWEIFGLIRTVGYESEHFNTYQYGWSADSGHGVGPTMFAHMSFADDIVVGGFQYYPNSGTWTSGTMMIVEWDS